MVKSKYITTELCGFNKEIVDVVAVMVNCINLHKNRLDAWIRN